MIGCRAASSCLAASPQCVILRPKSDAYRGASIGLILTQELTFWRSASKVGAYEAMSSLEGETEREVTDLANAAGRAVGGVWSIDLLETQRGWMVTDMAEAEKSWHEWPDCPNTFERGGYIVAPTAT
jgi:hypothetical protein